MPPAKSAASEHREMIKRTVKVPLHEQDLAPAAAGCLKLERPGRAVQMDYIAGGLLVSSRVFLGKGLLCDTHSDDDDDDDESGEG